MWRIIYFCIDVWKHPHVLRSSNENSDTVQKISEDAMEDVLQKNVKISVDQKKTGFNLNKFHAVVCMLASAIVSVSLIVWAVKAIF